MPLAVSWVGLLLLGTLEGFPPSAGDRPGDVHDLGPGLPDAIATAYSANLNGPRFGTIRFRLLNGEALNLDVARQGEIPNSAVADGLYVFDGPRGRYECVFPSATIAAHRTRLDENRWRTRLNLSVRAVTDGRLCLADIVDVDSDDRTDSHTAQIEPGVDVYARSLGLPIGPRVPVQPRDSLEAMIKGTLQDHTWTLTVEEHVDHEGVDTVLLHFDNGQPGRRRIRYDFWVDLARGALPRRVRSQPNEPPDAASETFFDDLRLVDGKCWLPFRMTLGHQHDRYVRHFAIDEVDLSTRPPASSYALEFPQEIPMVNAATMLRYAPRKTWDLANLPGPSSRETTKLKLQEPSVLPPPMPGERPARSWWPAALWLAAGAALLATAGYVFWRRRHA